MTESTQQDARRRTLWFGVLGGAIAWLVHLLASYTLGEFGCLTWLKGVRFWGTHGVAWALLLVSVATAAVAGAAAIEAFRLERAHREGATGPERELARIAWIMSGLFFLIILFESVPTFYFLGDC